MTVERYSRVAMALHWAIAALLAFQLGLGWRMMALPTPAQMYAPFQFHKSIGITILVLSLARVIVRFVRPRPEASAHGWQGRLASAVHAALYVFMIAAPLTGWMLVSTARIAIPTRLFGTIPLPHLPLGQGWHEPAENAHGLLAWIGAALIVLHVAGALRHHLPRDGSGVLGRMLPGTGNGRNGLLAGVVAALGLVAAFLLPWLTYGSTGAAVPAATPDAAQSAAAMVEGASDAAQEPEPDASASIPADQASAMAEDEAAGPPKWQVLPGGNLGFKVAVNGEAVDGRFSGWSADVALDPEDPKGGTITVMIPVLSAVTGDDTRDTMLKGEDFFGAGPATAVYRSSAITKVGANAYAAAGKLSLNRVTRPLGLRFTLGVKGDVATVNGSASFDRTAFGVGKGEWAGTEQIAGKVDVSFAFKARQTK